MKKRGFEFSVALVRAPTGARVQVFIVYDERFLVVCFE